ncbi:UDP-glycosyltransferase 73C3 [Acorus gramineus]|uniref:Glycosyltransferase n=1 Tax=Acorus gramineus TaxID=55184 RepID=A0AAV9AU44_ACOGR|nr:UDP-glycosyltransferase 73C3 [Acorus gramineus]
MKGGPNNEEEDGLHFVLLPFMAQGHMIPMLDLAKLLSLRGASVSFITTPLNAARLRPSVDRAASVSPRPISLVELPFPSAAAGLPDACENVDELPSPDLGLPFIKSTKLLLGPSLHYLRHHHPPPSCVITDSFLPWAREIAREFGVPRLVFQGISCFSTLCIRNLREHGVLERAGSECERLVVPGIPHEVAIKKSQMPGTQFKDLRAEMREAEATADGVVVNSYEELEREYLNIFRATTGKKVWMVGPFSLANADEGDKIVRGKETSSEYQCMDWLERKEPKSVVYVSFGSIGRLSPPQTAELARALEGSGRDFIWVVKSWDGLPEEFKERPITERRMVIMGWAPQVAILSHRAVGGFVTHCGWNSTVEALCAGVPMVCWPLFAEQFFNERQVVDVLRVGVGVGVENPNGWAGEEAGELVKREAVEKALEEVMEGGAEGVGRRERARELGDMARMATEVGGSSFVNLTRLIDYVWKCESTKDVRES